MLTLRPTAADIRENHDPQVLLQTLTGVQDLFCATEALEALVELLCRLGKSSNRLCVQSLSLVMALVHHSFEIPPECEHLHQHITPV